MNTFKKAVQMVGVVIALLSINAYAQGAIQAPPGGIKITKPFTTVGQVTDNIICQVLNWMFYGAILLTVVYVLLAAFGYVTSAGDVEKVGKAKKQIIYAAVGVAIAMVAFGLPYIVANLIGSSVGAFCSA